MSSLSLFASSTAFLAIATGPAPAPPAVACGMNATPTCDARIPCVGRNSGESRAQAALREGLLARSLSQSTRTAQARERALSSGVRDPTRQLLGGRGAERVGRREQDLPPAALRRRQEPRELSGRGGLPGALQAGEEDHSGAGGGAGGEVQLRCLAAERLRTKEMGMEQQPSLS